VSFELDVNEKRDADKLEGNGVKHEVYGRPYVSRDWREAVVVSFILTLAQIFIAFLTLYDLNRIPADPASFAFDLFRFSGASFFGTFVALTGLSKYYDL
jgi:hypothetical protein